MRTRIFSTPNSGAPTVSWLAGNATAGITGSLLPFTTSTGEPAGGGGTFSGPGAFISAQFSLSMAPSALYLALDTNGATSGVNITLESYSNFAWTVLDAANLSGAAATVNLPAASQLTLLRLRVSVAGNASVQCVAILNTTSAPVGGGGPSGGTTTGDYVFRKDLTGVSGGLMTDLDGVATLALPTGILYGLCLASEHYIEAHYQLRQRVLAGGGGAGSSGSGGSGGFTFYPNGTTVIQPGDSDPQINNRVWVRTQ